MFNHNGLNHGYQVKHIYKNRTSRVHTRFSLPRPVHLISSLLPFTCMNERFKIIIVQECRGPSWNLQTFYSRGEEKVIWALCQINNNANESHSTFSSWSSPRYNSSKKKRISEKHTKVFLEFLVFLSKQIREKQKREKLFTRESSQQAKEEREIFLGFLFNYYSKEINYYYFFGFFLRFIKHTRRKQENKSKHG